MTESTFRRLALGLPEAVAGEHHGHPDFRVGGRIFATLRYPERGWAMVKLTPAQQRSFIAAAPSAFVPVAGGWGRRGNTNVRLAKAAKGDVLRSLIAAFCNVAPKRLLAEFDC
jgi:hypothetical protein